MLHYQTVEPETLELLKYLQAIPTFKNLHLVGGTALALRIGHRKSIDIDLFGKIEDIVMLDSSISKLGDSTLLNRTSNIANYILST